MATVQAIYENSSAADVAVSASGGLQWYKQSMQTQCGSRSRIYNWRAAMAMVQAIYANVIAAVVAASASGGPQWQCCRQYMQTCAVIVAVSASTGRNGNGTSNLCKRGCGSQPASSRPQGQPNSNLHKRAYAATAVPVRRRHAMKVPERINSAEAVVERKAAQRTRQANAQPLNQARDKCGCREQLDLASAQLDLGKSAQGSLK